jgi:hypothetical protein
MGGQQSSSVIEVQVRQHDHVDVLVPEAVSRQRVEQAMPFILDAEPFAQLRREERSDPRFEQDPSTAGLLHQCGPAGQRNAILLVGGDPLRPQRLRRVAEHGAAVEALRVAEERDDAMGTAGVRPWRQLRRRRSRTQARAFSTMPPLPRFEVPHAQRRHP